MPRPRKAKAPQRLHNLAGQFQKTFRDASSYPSTMDYPVDLIRGELPSPFSSFAFWIPVTDDWSRYYELKAVLKEAIRAQSRRGD